MSGEKCTCPENGRVAGCPIAEHRTQWHALAHGVVLPGREPATPMPPTPTVPDNAGLRAAQELLFPELANELPHNRSRFLFADEVAAQIERIAALLAERDDLAAKVAAVRAHADELASHRGGHDADAAADIRHALGDPS